MVSKVLRAAHVVNVLVRPDKRLTNINPWVLTNPRSHKYRDCHVAQVGSSRQSVFQASGLPCHQGNLSNSRSAHPLIDNSGLCTSSDWKTMRLHLFDPMVIISQRLSPRLGMCAPLATSFTTPSRDNRFCIMLMPSHNARGTAVMQAPESTVILICVQSSGLSMARMPGFLTCCDMLRPAVDDG